LLEDYTRIRGNTLAPHLLTMTCLTLMWFVITHKVADLKRGKAAGLRALSAEHLLFYHPVLGRSRKWHSEFYKSIWSTVPAAEHCM